MDREKVIKGMEQFRSDFKPFCGGKADWERFDAGLALLKEQEAVVRCKDCVHWDKHTEECGNPDSVCFRNGWCKPDWFCGDGKRKEGR